jgi:hypothetical protein
MVSKIQFVVYRAVQYGGQTTNMFDIQTVIALSGGILSKAVCLDILENYDKYFEQWGKEIEAEMKMS